MPGITLSEAERRFLAEIETHIRRARTGAESDEARAVLALYCRIVERGETPPAALLAHLASAFRAAMLAAGDDPAKIDVRKPLGLIRARAGNPHRKTLLTADESAELAVGKAELPSMSFDYEAKIRKRVARERNVEIGVAIENEFVRQLEELARGEPSLARRAMDVAVDVVKRRFAAEGITLDEAKIKRARAALSEVLRDKM
jgi:hypothetical protein